MASRIVDLSNKVLSTGTTSSGYIPLKIESGPYSNAVAVGRNWVRCFIQSTALLEKAREEGFDPRKPLKTAPFNEHKFYFDGLCLGDIDAHETLFAEIVKESVKVIMDRRPKKN